jgi:hypothetical protein
MGAGQPTGETTEGTSLAEDAGDDQFEADDDRDVQVAPVAPDEGDAGAITTVPAPEGDRPVAKPEPPPEPGVPTSAERDTGTAPDPPLTPPATSEQ